MTACLSLTVLLAALAGMPDTTKMNILFIDIEDCNAGVWGCAGNPICQTPHLDRFAHSAVRFDSAYCQAICCNPTRTSFLTGLRPLSTHVFTNSDVMKDHLPPGVLTLPEFCNAKGFTTADVGKLFHTVEYAPKQMAAFDRIEMYEKPPGWKGPKPILTFPPPNRPSGWKPAADRQDESRVPRLENAAVRPLRRFRPGPRG